MHSDDRFTRFNARQSFPLYGSSDCFIVWQHYESAPVFCLLLGGKSRNGVSWYKKIHNDLWLRGRGRMILYKATQSRFAVYCHCPHAILKIPFIIHYLSLPCESTQNVKIFNTAMLKTFISLQYLNQQIEANIDLSRSRQSNPYICNLLPSQCSYHTHLWGAWLTLMNKNGQWIMNNE